MGFFLGKYSTLDRVNEAELGIELMLRRVVCEFPSCGEIAVGIANMRIPALLCDHHMPVDSPSQSYIYRCLATVYAGMIYRIAMAAHHQPHETQLVTRDSLEALASESRAAMTSIATPDAVKVFRENAMPDLDLDLFTL